MVHKHNPTMFDGLPTGPITDWETGTGYLDKVASATAINKMDKLYCIFASTDEIILFSD